MMADLIEIPIVVKDKGLKQSITTVSQLEKRIAAAAKAVDAGAMSQDRFNKVLLQAKRDYQGLGLSSQKATYEVRKYAQAQKEAAAAARINQTAMRTLTGSKTRFAAAASSASDATSRVRQSFLNTANSVAILDGPLGGIASRFSAFGVLIGRTGLLLGGFMVALSSLGVAIGVGIRSFIQFEVATAKIGAILRATGKDAEFAGGEIEGMVSRIAMSTLESEQAVRSAATQLLTFRSVGKEVFEDVLKSASDMAAAGFGTVESEAVKLAKALEDPRQSLTSLSRSGITFTRQQRQLIISLVESGRQAEAMAKILETVNGQVGGAGEAAARDTMAGSFDTIGQAVGLATRQLGQFVVEATGLDSLLARLAERAAGFIGSQSDPRSLRIQELRREIEALEDLEVVESRLGMAALSRGQTTQRALDLRLAPLQEELRGLERQIELEDQLRASTQATQQVQQRSAAIDNIKEEIDLRMQAVGLSDVELRAQRALAAEGLFRVDAAKEMETYIQKLRESGKSIEEITDATREFAKVLVEAESLYDKLVESFNREAQGRAFLRNLEALEDQNELLTLQLSFMDQGLEAAEARRQAEYMLQLALAETLNLEGKITDEKLAQLRAAIVLNNELSSDLAGRTTVTRGGSGRAPTSMQDLVNQRLTEISQEKELLGLYGRQRREREILFQLQKQNKDADIKLTEAQLVAAAKLIEQEENYNNLIRERRELQENLAKTIENSMENAFMSMVDGTKSVQDAFKDMARQIIAELYRVIVVQRIVGNVGGGGLAGGLGRILGISNMASGGTMRANQPYLVGERGPELVVPGRNATIFNADLTKKASSSSGDITVNNNINVSGGSDPAAIRMEVAKLMPQITEATKTAVIDARRRGGQMRAAFS
jgi:hypothetical protein